MSDTYQCRYCGKTRHQLSPGKCIICNDNPNYLSDLQEQIRKLTWKNERLEKKFKKLKDINNHLGEGI